MQFVVITNIPSPYRVFFFNELYTKIGSEFCVLYCAKIESDRQWGIQDIRHPHFFLKTKKIRKNLYWKSDIWKMLTKLKPETIITAGFTPVMLKAFLFTRLKKRKHIVFTDSWLNTVHSLSKIHLAVRKYIFKRTHAFICIGKKGKEYLEYFKADKKKIYISPITIKTSGYNNLTTKKKYDIVFSGQLIERKMPLFFCKIVIELQKLNPSLKVLILGAGPLHNQVISTLKAENVNFTHPGYVNQRDLPYYYQASKILLFPTKLDHWGVVANEACAAGLPIVISKNAGAANDLVLDNYNGYVLDNKLNNWVDKSNTLLQNQDMYKIFSDNSLKQTRQFNINIALKGFIDAVKN